MDVLIEREGSDTQVGNRQWGDGTELAVRNLWWPEGAEHPFPRHIIPMRTALEGVEMAAEGGLLTEQQIIEHCATLLNSLVRERVA